MIQEYAGERVIGWVQRYDNRDKRPYTNKDSNGFEVLLQGGNKDWWGLTSCKEILTPLDPEKEIEKDTINPDHYKIGGIETIDYLKAKLTPEQFKGYCLGNIIKYTSRHQYKNGEEDLKKSQWYMNKLLETLEG